MRVLRQDLNLKDVHEPSSNRKPMYFMLSMLYARPRLSPRTPQPTPCAAAPKALTSVGRAPFAAPTSSRWPKSSPRRRGRLARRCEAGPGRGSLPLSAPRARVQAAHPARPSLPVQVDAEEWAQVPEDQPIADISLVHTVRAASTHPRGVCRAQALQPRPEPRPRVRSRTRTSWCG